MKISFLTLFTVALQHTYYGGPCSDFEFVIPPSTAEVLRGGKLLARVVDGRLNVLFEVDAEKQAITSLAGQTLTFGLRLTNPWFSNFTVPVISDSKLVPFFTNSGISRALDPPIGMTLASGAYSYVPKTATRPLQVRLSDSQNQVLARETVAVGSSDISFDLRRLPDGPYRIEEEAAVGPQLELLVSAELRNAELWGIVAVNIDARFYTVPAAFVVSFAARTEHLKYFVVADRFSDAEFAELKVKDAGFGDDSRDEVIFDRVPSAEFSKEQGDIFPPTLLGDVSRVVMFRSHDPVARRARGLRKIQLKRKEDEAGILIGNLPLPGADRPQAHFIVHLSNPRGA